MKHFFLFLFLVFLLLSIPESKTFAASENILLSEIQITGGTGHTNDDFVELYNPTDASVNISDFRLRYRNSKGAEGSLRVFETENCIPPKGFFLWANSSGAFASLADTTTSGTLSNDYSVLLYPKEGTTPLDTLHFGNGTLLPNPGAGQSLMQDPLTHNWSLNTTPTPTKSTPCPKPEPPVPVITHVRINEILPFPKDKEEEFIELYNDSDIEADLSTFSLHDASQSGEYIFPSGTIITSHAYFVFLGSVSKIALNNSDETLSLFDNTHALIDSMSYKTAKEGISINFTGSDWRGGIPTPGAPNQLNNLPETREKVPKEGYHGMPVFFDARGKDVDGSTLKYTWDFGDGHKSYLGKTTHLYKENGTYQVTLKTTDGSDDVIETFTLKIISFPKLDIRITSLSPNPAGKDSENEWLIIENREKKAINLEGWSIATGWDNMVNHPIRERFVIPAKSQAKLTRDFSLFTLPNKKSRIELRAPNGKVLQEIEYKEKKSISEDAVYYKEKGKRWTWKKKTEEVETPTANEETAEIEATPQEAPEEILPSESSTIEEKGTDPQVVNVQTIDQGSLRQEFYHLLHHHAWVDVSETPAQSRSSSLVSSSFTFQTLLSKANTALNNWQNK